MCRVVPRYQYQPYQLCFKHQDSCLRGCFDPPPTFPWSDLPSPSYRKDCNQKQIENEWGSRHRYLVGRRFLEQDRWIYTTCICTFHMFYITFNFEYLSGEFYSPLSVEQKTPNSCICQWERLLTFDFAHGNDLWWRKSDMSNIVQMNWRCIYEFCSKT